MLWMNLHFGFCQMNQSLKGRRKIFFSIVFKISMMVADPPASNSAPPPLHTAHAESLGMNRSGGGGVGGGGGVRTVMHHQMCEGPF